MLKTTLQITWIFLLFLIVLNLFGQSQLDIEGSGNLLNIRQDLFTANVVVIRATDSAGGATVNEGSDILTLQSADTGFGQFIEMERGAVVVARINTDGSAQFKSIQFPDNTIQTTAAFSPLAYGAIKAGGGQLSGSTNISSNWDPSSDTYNIKIVGTNYISSEFTTVVTPNSSIVNKVWTEDDGAGNLTVHFLDDNFGPTQADFQFVVYQ